MAPPRRSVNIGLIGHGTVGSAFTRALARNADRITQRLDAEPRVMRIAVRRPEHIRLNDSRSVVSDDPEAVAADPSIDVVIDASSAPAPLATRWLTAALSRGAAVISANKLAIASSPDLLASVATRHPLFHCESAVAAGVPVIRALRDSLEGEEIHELRGLLNGTSTFILSGIERGLTFDDALTHAVGHGYTELDGAGDVDGRDAAAKLAILATLAWRRPTTADQVRRSGFDSTISRRVSEARSRGCALRLVAQAWRGNIPRLVVEVRELELADPLAAVDGVTSALEVRAELAGLLRWFGPGAGGDCTASGLIGDLIAACDALRRSVTRSLAA
ncbi:MAG: homoserine dehydrogenase [Gemmatimonadota bacterium]